MALAARTRLGPYEITGPLGAGGMGEVYRGRDSRLDRAVAVKVLPEGFSQDPRLLAAAQKADARSDLFSLGCVLYEMLSGKRAFVRETVPETLTAILREDPPSLAGLSPPLPGPLERLVLHCLEKRPEDRFQSARDLAFALRAVARPSSSSCSTGRPSWGRGAGPRGSRHDQEVTM